MRRFGDPYLLSPSGEHRRWAGRLPDVVPADSPNAPADADGDGAVIDQADADQADADDVDGEDIGEDEVEEASEESFPASDAPASWSGPPEP